MTLGGSTHLIHPRRIGHSDPPETIYNSSLLNYRITPTYIFE
ncbi:hypothetical protein T4A_3504 [Trichinella pseudospiralis]|uniref:Uncharacterized protein n=1 Tax=Trichinella pseudospiralis TaxID=6337 RepID=A0A0V1DKF9_TRIPS|nr:hypothetical protein T4A_3504 [Trichinella pseudospiralis]